MSLPPAIADAVEAHTGAVRRAVPVGGGCIGQAVKLGAQHGTFFCKWGTGDVAATFAPEAEGLEVLAEAAEGNVCVPRPIATGDYWLLLPWLPSAPADQAHWTALGEGLAQLHHRRGEDRFGWSRDNFIGRTPQVNTWHTSWPAFFSECRLQPQIALARRNGHWAKAWDAASDVLLARLPELLPATPHASPLHGDLWSGNVLATTLGPAVIDPAFYWGDRETDLAMTQLFGGFDAVFYDAYRAVWPLAPGYEERAAVYKLYHLINHLNLFGSGYAGRVQAVLQRFG